MLIDPVIVSSSIFVFDNRPIMIYIPFWERSQTPGDANNPSPMAKLSLWNIGNNANSRRFPLAVGMSAHTPKPATAKGLRAGQIL